MRRLWVALLCATAGIAVLAGCDSKPPPPKVSMADVPAESMEPDGDAQPTDAPAPSPANPGNAASPEVAAPLPDDVPLYAKASPISSMSSPDRGTIVNLRSDDDADRVFAWYASEMPARGWELEKQTGAAGSHLLIAHKGERKATVLITSSPNGAQILLTVLEDR